MGHYPRHRRIPTVRIDLRPLIVVCAVTCVAAVSGAVVEPSPEQLDSVRSRIRLLEQQLVRLDAESADVARESEQLGAELELAKARVRENELLLESSRAEADQLRAEVAGLADDLVTRRELVQKHLEMAVLLGGPGPIQLLFDAARGGDLEQAVSTVAVLTAAQVRLMQEYDVLSERHTERLADLSVILDRAEGQARSLETRRYELESTRARVEDRMRKIQRSQRKTGTHLADLRQREQALARLMEVLSSRDRFTGKEDIRRYRGALPWPVDGTVVQTFGRHYLPKYSTYTICNGNRYLVPGGAPVRAVFPGVVAFAQHFKGYGNMVVVDHGNNVYSLAAGLATIHVRLDQRVSMGSQLGLASPPSEEGNVYFEIRGGEEPQDPRRWLQLAEGQ